MNKKICEMVTDRILEELAAGVVPWDKPWSGSSAGAISHTTGKPYSLLNQMILGRPGEYLTFNQCKAEGGKVKKGAKGCPVIFWKQVKIGTVQIDDGSEVDEYAPVLRYYTVFHIGDCEGITAKHPVEKRVHLVPAIEAEAIINDYQQREGITILRDNTSDEAYYSVHADYIKIPRIDQYSHIEGYYSTLFHELTHSTGHFSRLDRFSGSAHVAFGSAEYSKEELIAEIGAAALNNYCGLESLHSIQNSAAYIDSWTKAIKGDPTMIIAAAGKAEKAFNYIVGE